MINWRKPLIYILSFLQGSKRMKYYHRILKYDKMSERDLKKLQNEKLEKLLLHSYKNVPYYRKVLKEAGVIVQDKVNLENFERIPILTKDILRKEYDNLKSNDLENRKWYTNHSGGSTGEPTEFIQDKEMEDWNIANKFFYRKYANHNIGDLEFRLWGSERDFLGDKESLIKRLKYFFFNRKDLNAFTMSEDNMKDFLDLINKEKPLWIEAYVEAIYEITLFAIKNKIQIQYIPKGILTSAGTLYPEMKEILAKYWKCKIINRYGSREVGDMACGTDFLKVSPWNHVLEIYKPNEHNLGKILVTTLNNYSMPLIRYDIGDIGVQDEKSWLYLKEVQGRELSAFRNRGGKIVPGIFLVHFLGVVMNTGVIKRFQAIQEDYEKIHIKIVVNNKKEFEKEKLKIEELINKAMEAKCNIKWEYVVDIPKLKSGKYLYVISNLKN